MLKINRNVMAAEVTIREGKKKSVSIAQVKEVQRLTLLYLSTFNIASVWRLLRMVRKEAKSKKG